MLGCIHKSAPCQASFSYKHSKQRLNLEQMFSTGDGHAGAQASARKQAQDSERGLRSQSDTHKAVFPQETTLCVELIPDFTLTPRSDVMVVNILKTTAQCAKKPQRMHQECERGRSE